MFSDQDRSAIEALHAAWLNAERQGRSAAVLEFCTAAPVWLPPGEAPLCGRAAIQAWLDAQPATTLLRIDISDLTIAGLGTCAWKAATFRTTMANPADGGAVTISGTHGWLLQRDDVGAWRIAVVTWAII